MATKRITKKQAAEMARMAEIVERRMPVGEKAVLEYLASGAIKGVGLATARRLVDAFGEDVLTVIEENPQELTKIKGIGDAKAKALLAVFGGITGVKNATEAELSAVKGISKTDAENIRAYYDTKK